MSNSEDDIKRRFIAPAIEKAGWDKHTQIKPNELFLTVSFNYEIDNKYCDIDISFPRVAGYVGYGNQI